jgi:hypothetical protein
MKKIVRPRNVLLALVLLLVVWVAEFAFRKNNICSVEDHAIRSEADAIEVARRKIVKDSFFSSRSFGSAHEFEGTLDETENCCSATRSRNIFGVIVWRVHLEAKASAKHNRRTVFVEMSSCGEISHDGSYKDVAFREGYYGWK